MLTITPNQTLPQNCGNLAPIINKSPSLILCPQKVEILPPPLILRRTQNLTQILSWADCKSVRQQVAARQALFSDQSSRIFTISFNNLATPSNVSQSFAKMSSYEKPWLNTSGGNDSLIFRH